MQISGKLSKISVSCRNCDSYCGFVSNYYWKKGERFEVRFQYTVIRSLREPIGR